MAQSPRISAGASGRSAAPRRSPRRCRWWRRRRCARRSRRRSPRRRSRGGSIASSAARPPGRVDFQHPLLEVRAVRRRAVILVAGRQGAVRRAQHQRLPPGRAVRSRRRRSSSPPAARPRSSSRARGRQLAAEFAYGDSPTFAEARAIAAFARDLFLKRRGGPGADRRHAVRQHADAGGGHDRVPAGRRDHGAEGAGRRIRRGARRRHGRDRVRAERRGASWATCSATTSTSTSTTCC